MPEPNIGYTQAKLIIESISMFSCGKNVKVEWEVIILFELNDRIGITYESGDNTLLQ